MKMKTLTPRWSASRGPPPISEQPQPWILRRSATTEHTAIRVLLVSRTKMQVAAHSVQCIRNLQGGRRRPPAWSKSWPGIQADTEAQAAEVATFPAPDPPGRLPYGNDEDAPVKMKMKVTMMARSHPRPAARVV